MLMISSQKEVVRKPDYGKTELHNSTMNLLSL